MSTDAASLAAPPATDAELAALLGDFERGELPLDRWTHAAHVMVALRYVRSHGPDEALAVMRGALLRYLVARGVNPGGYHETITRAWIELIARFDRAHAAMPYGEAAALAAATFGDKRLLARHYSPEALASTEARAAWMPPDLAPFDSATTG